jgi:Calcium/calmodulin dependent protein kinase II association domain
MMTVLKRPDRWTKESCMIRWAKVMLTGVLLGPAAVVAQDAPMDPVVTFFTALSDSNPALMRTAVTDDVQILEQGEVWDLATLLSILKPRTSVRRNFFSVISEHVRGDTALINYWNKTQEKLDTGEQRTRAWLESVVAIRVDGQWKILQLHSSRLTPEQIPSNVEFVERR